MKRIVNLLLLSLLIFLVSCKNRVGIDKFAVKLNKEILERDDIKVVVRLRRGIHEAGEIFKPLETYSFKNSDFQDGVVIQKLKKTDDASFYIDFFQVRHGIDDHYNDTPGRNQASLEMRLKVKIRKTRKGISSSNETRYFKIGNQSENFMTNLKGIDCSHLLKSELGDIVEVEERISQSTAILDFSKYTSAQKCLGKNKVLYSFDNESMKKRDVQGREKRGLSKFFVGNFFTPEQDRGLGREFKQQFIESLKKIEVEKGLEGKILIDPNQDGPFQEVGLYVSGLMDRIDSVSRADNEHQFGPDVVVVNLNIKNAFALPGGFVVVFSGLLNDVKDESELMGVLAHEWAHVVARHGTRKVSRMLRYVYGKVALKLALNLIGLPLVKDDFTRGKVAQLLGVSEFFSDLFHHFAGLNKGRNAELQADLLGTQYALRVGHQPWGIGKMFHTFSQTSPMWDFALARATYSHPVHKRRIALANAYSSFFYPDTPPAPVGGEYISRQVALDHSILAEMIGIADSINQNEGSGLAFAFANQLANFGSEIVQTRLSNDASIKSRLNSIIDVAIEKQKELEKQRKREELTEESLAEKARQELAREIREEASATEVLSYKDEVFNRQVQESGIEREIQQEAHLGQ